ncbi:MAG: magnesium and cobalt transport protein CorA, partial [Micrococcales bacterium]|nr:magnesium and cobalt transport protein CorA [Micrococcales bacterium]
MTDTPSVTEPAVTLPGSVLKNVVYGVDGRRLATPSSFAEDFRLLKQDPQAIAWIGMLKPSAADLAQLAAEFDLHPLAIEDAVLAHQRPKIERYDDTRFVVLKAAYYDDLREVIHFGELHVFFGQNFVITVRHGDSPKLTPVRDRMEQLPDAFAEGTEAVVYAILDAVVDGYYPVVAGLENDIDEIETQVFDGDPLVSKRIYTLNREVIEFERAVSPLVAIVDELSSGWVDGSTSDTLEEYLRDVADHVVYVKERLDEFKALLRDILTVYASLVGQRQNEEAQQLSA